MKTKEVYIHVMQTSENAKILKLTLYLSEELDQLLRAKAKEEGRTITAFTERILRKYFRLPLAPLSANKAGSA